MKPTIGRIVMYNPTKEEKETMEKNPNCNVADKLPGVVVAVWSETTINLKVMLDGQGDLWKTSAQQGEGEGQWHFPVIQ